MTSFSDNEPLQFNGWHSSVLA